MDDQLTVDIDEGPAFVRRPDGPLRWVAIDLLALSVIVAIGVAKVFELPSASLRVPFGYSDDALGVETSAKMIIESGWIQTTSRLGAPFHLDLHDFPAGGDHLHYLIMKVLSWGTHDWVLLINVFYLLSFFTAAWSAYLCQRWLRVGRVAAIVTSALFTFAPFHFMRGLSHLLLASYFAVPIGVLLAVRASSNPLFSRAVSRWKTVRGLLPWIVLCAIAGSCGVYYTGFALLGIVVACSASAGARRSWRPIGRGALYGGTILLTFIVNLSGSLLYWRRNGTNPAAIKRYPLEFDLYGLRPIQLITPVPGHWLHQLTGVTDDLSSGFRSEYTQFLGLVGGAALIAMLVGLLLAGLRTDESPTDARRLLSVMTVVYILIGVTGGFVWTLSLIGFTELRAWGRISIVIMFTVLCWLGLTAGSMARRVVAGHRGRRRGAFALAAVVLVFGMTDQGSVDIHPDPDNGAVAFKSDRDFFHAVEAQLPPEAMVYLFPYRQFPETAPTYSSGDYDLLRPFLHTSELRFSYAGMKGRDAEWQEQLLDLPPDQLIHALVAVGFEGAVIDRFGYIDQSTAFTDAVIADTGLTPLLSPDGRWWFFDLTDQAQRYDPAELASTRLRLLSAPRVVFTGCTPLEGADVNRFQWCQQHVTALATRAIGEPAPFTYTAGIQSPGGNGTLHVTIDGVESTYPITTEITTLTLQIPGIDDVEIDLFADVPVNYIPGDPRDLRFRLIHATITSP